MSTAPLRGYTIGVTADRRSDEQMKLLTGRGADCVHGPTIKTHPVDSADALRQATQTVIDQRPSRIVLTTGVGVRSWLEAADALHLGEELRGTLAESALLARGPKANGAAVTAGFEVVWTAPRAVYADVVAELSDVEPEVVAVQLDGAGAEGLCRDIASLGHTVIPVPVYRWSLPEDVTPAERLVRLAVEGRLDAITFTARPAVDNLLDIAEQSGLADQLIDVMTASLPVFCVGPVCAAGLDDHPSVPVHVPERHRLGALVQLVTHHLVEQTRHVELAGIGVTVQGRHVHVDGSDPVDLTGRERSVLMTLLERPGVVLSKRELLQRVWLGTEQDEHVVEVTVGRLRRRLGPAAVGVETVVRRGYRASAL